MRITPVFREYRRFRLQQHQVVSSSWKNVPLKTALFLLSVMAILAPSMSVKAEIIMGMIETYNPQTREATISLGEQDGVGKYDRGKIELTSLDNPNVRFIGANIVVIRVEENFAVVSVREAPGVPVPIEAGARISLDTESGIARREEEAKIIAAQRAEETRRQQQLAEVKAEQARRQRELEAQRAAEIQRQQEQLAAEQAAAEARRQEQLAAEQAAAEARRQEQLAAQQAAAARQQEQKESTLESEDQAADLEEAKDLWQNQGENKPPANAADLPLDYLQAYTKAREEPSPETYYRFAQILIDYEIYDQALNWLQETRSRFPQTSAVNDLYRGVVLIQQGEIATGQNIIQAVNLPDHPLTAGFRSYVATQQGQWQEVLAVAEPQQSATTYNNYLIARYCTQPYVFERDTDLTKPPCPFGEVESQPVKQDLPGVESEELDDDERERIAAAREKNRQQLRQQGQQALKKYPEDPYIHNTLGFIALQAEDYQQAYKHYEQLAKILDRYETTPPRLQLLKANAIKYVNNYNQNYEFLAENGADLESLRSSQNSLSDAILIGGAGSAIVSALSNDVSPVGLVGGILGTFLRFNQSQSRAKDISQERNSIADQMYTTFTQDINLVPTPPDLTADSWLKLTANGVRPDLTNANDAGGRFPPREEQSLNGQQSGATSGLRSLDSEKVEERLRQFDQFWQQSK